MCVMTSLFDLHINGRKCWRKNWRKVLKDSAYFNYKIPSKNLRVHEMPTGPPKVDNCPRTIMLTSNMCERASTWEISFLQFYALWKLFSAVMTCSNEMRERAKRTSASGIDVNPGGMGGGGAVCTYPHSFVRGDGLYSYTPPPPPFFNDRIT